jgi:hypothetical protein
VPAHVISRPHWFVDRYDSKVPTDAPNKLPHRVFYSWQSDLPNRTNRGLIEHALAVAIKTITKDDSLALEVRMDSDTRDIPGSPDISDSIFKKIEQCQAFVADVSLVGQEDAEIRNAPNPNVLIELGYAAKALGWERVVMVHNTATGVVEKLPFDLRGRRLVTYEVAAAAEIAAPRAQLAKTLELRIRAVLAIPTPPAIEETSVYQRTVESLRGGKPDRMLQLAEYLDALFQSLQELRSKDPRSLDDLATSLEQSAPLTDEFHRLMPVLMVAQDDSGAHWMMSFFSKIAEQYRQPKDRGGSYQDQDFAFFRIVGKELFVILVSAAIKANNLAFLERILSSPLEIPNAPRGDTGAPEMYHYLGASALTGHLKPGRHFSQQFSALGAYLHHRHEEGGELSKSPPFKDYAAADVFLYCHSRASGWDHRRGWWPDTALYVNEPPPFLRHALTMDGAERLSRMLSISGDKLKELILEAIVTIRKQPGYDGFLDDFQVQNIGTRK